MGSPLVHEPRRRWNARPDRVHRLMYALVAGFLIMAAHPKTFFIALALLLVIVCSLL